MKKFSNSCKGFVYGILIGIIYLILLFLSSGFSGLWASIRKIFAFPGQFILNLWCGLSNTRVGDSFRCNYPYVALILLILIFGLIGMIIGKYFLKNNKKIKLALKKR